MAPVRKIDTECMYLRHIHQCFNHRATRFRLLIVFKICFIKVFFRLKVTDFLSFKANIDLIMPLVFRSDSALHW